MRAPITFALCLAFTLACAPDSAAQRRREPAARRPADTSAAPPRAPRPAWTISEQPHHEDGESTTLVSLQPMSLGAAAGGRAAFSFGVNLIYEGNNSANFKNVALNLFSRSLKCLFTAEGEGLRGGPSVELALDGKPLTLPYRPDAKGADGVWWASNETEAGPCTETFVAYISPATLARLARARTLTGKVGAETFQFTAENLAALRDFVSKVAMPQLAPQPARPRPRR